MGKSTFLKSHFPTAIHYDLLKSNEYLRLKRKPELLRQELESCDSDTLVVIDEIQKIPTLLDEIHLLMVERGIRFILCGSSARKLKRLGTNLLGGRAIRKVMHPLVSAEIPDFDLIKAVNNGMVPRHYLVKDPYARLEAYIGVYLQEEIEAEAEVRNLEAFTRFLEVAAMSDGEMLNYTNIAQDCGVRSATVRSYFEILSQTLLGYLIPGFTESKKRKAIAAPKFYYFDVGIVNYLRGRTNLKPGSDDFGHAFEHLIIQEIIAFLDYSGSRDSLSYWRSTSGYEVDAIIGKARVAIETKSSTEVTSRHTRGIKAFEVDFPECRKIIVSLDERPRILNGVEIMPCTFFLSQLWGGRII